jgi:anthranilate synthase component I
MLEPSLAEVERRAHEGTVIPVSLELLADLETPVSAYLKLARGSGSFLLESVEGGEHLGRYSFIGIEPTGTVTFREGEAELSGELGNGAVPFTDPLSVVDSLLRREEGVHVAGLPPFCGGAVGFLSYDVVRYFERIPAAAGPGLDLPLGILGWHRTVLAFDHLRRTVKIIALVPTSGDVRSNYLQALSRLQEIADTLAARSCDSASPAVARQAATPFASNVTREQFEESVSRAKEYIAAGDAIQVVLSQRLSVPTSASPLALYRALRSINPSPYMYFLDYGDFQVIGASPEMLVRVKDSIVSVHPIAGTRPRGSDDAEDERLATELASDEKEHAEHVMLVDLGRNDVGRVSEAGSVRVKQLLEVEKYSHVMHLVSHVEGKLRSDLRPSDALRAGFPAGTVSGAPKVRAMEIIAELEPDSRGPYAGAVGYFGFDGTIDTAIAIRTVVLMNGMAHIQVGAGIVADSVPEMEYQETMNKAAAMLRAINAAEAIALSSNEVAWSRP